MSRLFIMFFVCLLKYFRVTTEVRNIRLNVCRLFLKYELEIDVGDIRYEWLIIIDACRLCLKCENILLLYCSPEVKYTDIMRLLSVLIFTESCLDKDWRENDLYHKILFPQSVKYKVNENNQ